MEGMRAEDFPDESHVLGWIQCSSQREEFSDCCQQMAS